jgi:hypothetical protein
MGILRNAYKIMVRKREGNRPIVRYKCRWEGNIRMYLNRVGKCGLFASGSRPEVDFCENGNEPWGSVKRGQLLDWMSEC